MKVQDNDFITQKFILNNFTPYQLYQKLRYHSMSTTLQYRKGIYYPKYY
jgi:hypothetical protein